MSETRLRGKVAELLRDLLRVRTPKFLTVAPSGGLLAMTCGHRIDEVHPRSRDLPFGMPATTIGLHVYVLETIGGAATQLLPNATASWGPSWNPDGTSLVFFAHMNEEVGLWLWDRETWSTRCISTSPLIAYVHPLEWTNDGNAVFVLRPHTSSKPVDSPGPTNITEVPQPDVDVLFSPGREDGQPGEAPTKLIGSWDLDDRADVAAIEVNGGQITPIVSGIPAERLKVSPNRHWLAVLGHGMRPMMNQFGTVRELSVFDAESGALLHSISGLTALALGSGGPAWSPDSQRLAVIRNGRAVVQHIKGELTELPGPDTLADVGAWSLLWSPDGDFLLGLDTWDDTGRQIQGADGPSRMWAMQVASGGYADLALPEGGSLPETFQQSGRDVFWTDAEGRVGIVSRDRESRQRRLRWLPLDGSPGIVADVEPATLPHPGFRFYPGICADIGEEGKRVFYRAESETAPPEVWTMDLNGETARVSQLNNGLRSWDLKPARILDWVDDSGNQYRGALQLPTGHDGVSAVPVVVDTYPMPYWCDWFDDWEGIGVIFRQLLLAEGYGVFLPSRTVLPQPWSFARRDLDRFILTGLDELVRLGLADDRVAVMGMSLGGYMVNSVITTTQRFKAAVSGVGMSNVSSWFGQVTFNSGHVVTHGVTGARNMTGGAPSDYPDRYIEESPVFHLDNVETPLLIFHGDADVAAHPHQGYEMYVGLKYLGREVQLLTYHGEGHSPMHYTEPNRTHLIERILGFLHRHLVAGEVPGKDVLEQNRPSDATTTEPREED